MSHPEGTSAETMEGLTSDEIEGLTIDGDPGWGDYPIDTVLIRTEQRTVYDVVRRIDKDAFIMNPDFQRDFIWDEVKQSKLIESMLMRIPLPVFYLAENSDGRTVVVDGLQRLSTFKRFLNNELKLKLPTQAELHDKYFKELAPKLQNRIEDCNLVLYIIDDKVPERARLDIFERVNGGVPLTRQQMRNCLYMGPATTFLREEANTELFQMATGGSLRTGTMRDREFVNRFCAFHILGTEEYNEIDDYLARALKKMNGMSAGELAQLSSEFRNGLQNNYNLFGEHAFRKHTPDQKRRSVLNASLWDVMTTGLADIPQARVTERQTALRDGFYALLKDDEFIKSITYSTNSRPPVLHRFQAFTTLLAQVFDVDEN